MVTSEIHPSFDGKSSQSGHQSHFSGLAKMLPFPAKGTIPIHDDSCNRKQRQGAAKRSPQNLDRESPVVSKMQRAQPEDKRSAPGVRHAAMPESQLFAGCWVEIHIVHLSKVAQFASRHEQRQRVFVATWKEGSGKLCIWRGPLCLLDHLVHIDPWRIAP